jgi:myo-inositol-1(or 4)-monophosphatase
MTMHHTRLLELLSTAARAGGALALPYFRKGGATAASVNYKDEGSPVTEADIAVDRYLEATLKAALPDHGWLSEESVDDPARMDRKRVIIVDPIDGTRGFVSGDDSWCVSIGVVENGVPVAGVLFAPARDELYAAATGQGATLNGRRLLAPVVPSTRPFTFAGPASVAQRVHASADGAMQPFRKIPSLAYRLILLVRDEVDVASASKACHDWDIAAADVILSEAGYRVVNLDGASPVYNRPEPVHPALIAARHDRLARLA